MNLNDEKGHTLVALIVNKYGPGVILQDKKGNERMGLEVTKDGPSLTLNDENKNVRAVLGITSLETTDTGAKEVSAPSSLTLFDKEGKVIWRAP